jgi:uncharacterized protein with von Willebrand factor type A (vWA) domain
MKEAKKVDGSDIIMLTDAEDDICRETNDDIQELKDESGTRLFTIVMDSSIRAGLRAASDAIVNVNSFNLEDGVAKIGEILSKANAGE